MKDLLEDAKAELYEADPDGFTARRQELADGAREAGQPAVAKQIAALRKPTRSAWVVNRLVRSDPEVRARLDALGADLREAADGARLRELTTARARLAAEPTRAAPRGAGPPGGADGARLRELTTARSRLVDELTRAALATLPAPPAALREEVTATLDAAIADPEV